MERHRITEKPPTKSATNPPLPTPGEKINGGEGSTQVTGFLRGVGQLIVVDSRTPDGGKE